MDCLGTLHRKPLSFCCNPRRKNSIAVRKSSPVFSPFPRALFSLVSICCSQDGRNSPSYLTFRGHLVGRTHLLFCVSVTFHYPAHRIALGRGCILWSPIHCRLNVLSFGKLSLDFHIKDNGYLWCIYFGHFCCHCALFGLKNSEKAGLLMLK